MNKANYTFSSEIGFKDCVLHQCGWEMCEPPSAVEFLSGAHYHFYYVLSGKGGFSRCRQKQAQGSFSLRAGQGFLLCPGEGGVFTADSHASLEYVWLAFSGLKAPELLSLAGLGCDSPLYTGSDPGKQRLMRDEMLYIVNHNDASPLHLTGHLYLFLDALRESSDQRKDIAGIKSKESYANAAVTFIEQNYQRDIGVEDIAGFCGLNRSYFGKIFKDIMAVTPQEFLIQYRMAKACQLLKNSSLSIGDISARVGYPSQLHFSRAFKKVHGLSPRQWRAGQA